MRFTRTYTRGRRALCLDLCAVQGYSWAVVVEFGPYMFAWQGAKRRA